MSDAMAMNPLISPAPSRTDVTATCTGSVVPSRCMYVQSRSSTSPCAALAVSRAKPSSRGPSCGAVSSGSGASSVGSCSMVIATLPTISARVYPVSFSEAPFIARIIPFRSVSIMLNGAVSKTELLKFDRLR